jgi:hypothetical protein
MRGWAPGCVLSDRDRDLFCRLFENRVMSLRQIQEQCFQGIGFRTVSRRLILLHKNSYLERRRIPGPNGSAYSLYLGTPKSIKAITHTYRYPITSEICRSDSIEHDLVLVDLRRRIQKLTSVTNYLTENMLQACKRFSELDATRPFVLNNTDAAILIARKGKNVVAGFEFENSEKAKERYVRKLVSYYADPRSPVIFYVCENERIRSAVVQAEKDMIGNQDPRCFYANLTDVLNESADCTFTDSGKAKITLS